MVLSITNEVLILTTALINIFCRDGCEHAKEVIKPFDWTFYTTYKGTLLGDKKFQVVPTTERIDLEKLKVKEEIKFYEDICLFEDELADNGVAQLTVKMVHIAIPISISTLC